MNLKLIVPVTVFTAAYYGLAGLLLPAQAQERENEEPVELSNGQAISYTCYDRAGNIVFTTINPQETLGWELGCQEMPYESSIPDSPPVVHFQCYDESGGIAFTTVDVDVAEDSDLFCREIGHRRATPIPFRSVHYECYNTDGTVAFLTSYPQNTYGWKPGCRELQSQEVAAIRNLESSQPAYECFDVNGNVAFTTENPQDANRWKLGCRQIR